MIMPIFEDSKREEKNLLKEHLEDFNREIKHCKESNEGEADRQETTRVYNLVP
jgi:hypothetical protein